MMAAKERPHLTMPCDIESRRSEPRRRAAWHKDCPDPLRCECPGHRRDQEEPDQAAEQ